MVTPSGLSSGAAGLLLGLAPGDMDGKYFNEDDPPLEYLITITRTDLTPPLRTLDHLGEWKPE